MNRSDFRGSCRSHRAAALASCTLLALGARIAFGAEDLSQLDLTTLMQMDVTPVTAQRRIEDPNTVPISMTVLNAAAIDNLKLDSTADLQFAAPGITTTYTAVWMLPYIRGVGTDINSSGMEPSVAVYVDGVYQAQRVQTFVDLPDVERIEILKGPQGTLYGRNATGGAINITTRAPTQELQSAVSLTAGNLDLREGSAFIAGPLSSSMRASVAAHALKRDGFYTNILDGSAVNGEDYDSLHGRLQADLSGALRAELLFKQLRRGAMNTYATEMSGNSPLPLLGAQVATEPYETASELDDGGYRFKDSTTALKLNWNLDSLNLQSVSSYNKQRQRVVLDADMSSLPMATFIMHERASAMTQEFQLTPAPHSQRHDWLIGLFYIDSSDRFAPLEIETIVPGLGPVSAFFAGNVHTTAYAAFGEGTLALSPTLSVTGGLRYSTEEKRLTDAANGLEGISSTSFPDRHHRWDEVNYRLIAKYTTAHSMLYAKTETGFKSGAYNNVNPPNPGPIDPERITAYEVGIKTALPNHPVRLTAAAFYNDYRDLQIQLVDTPHGGASTLVQAPQAETYGVDLDLDLKLSQYWTITSGLTWLHTAYLEFPSNGALGLNPAGGFVPGTDLDLKGNRLSRSPELTYHLAASFDRPLATGTLFGAANYYRSSRLYFDPGNFFSQGAFGVLNAQLGYRSAARWWISAWAKNLNDATYLTTVVPVQFGAAGQYAAPRTYGITLGYSFAP